MPIHRAKWDWHPAVRTGRDLSFAERAIDGVAGFLGSPVYIALQTVVIASWIILNAIYIRGVWVWHWDAKPYILLNLLFSTQAAYSAPIILASQGRTDKKREERDQHDSSIGLETLELVKGIHSKLGS